MLSSVSCVLVLILVHTKVRSTCCISQDGLEPSALNLPTPPPFPASVHVQCEPCPSGLDWWAIVVICCTAGVLLIGLTLAVVCWRKSRARGTPGGTPTKVTKAATPQPVVVSHG